MSCARTRTASRNLVLHRVSGAGEKLLVHSLRRAKVRAEGGTQKLRRRRDACKLVEDALDKGAPLRRAHPALPVRREREEVGVVARKLKRDRLLVLLDPLADAFWQGADLGTVEAARLRGMREGTNRCGGARCGNAAARLLSSRGGATRRVAERVAER